MGIAERKEREKEEMRERILDAAVELFLSEGFEKTSLRAIAKKIEYSPATIYLYFKDKEDLLKAVFKYVFQKFLSKMQSFDPTKATREEESFHHVGENYINFALENPHAYELMFMSTVNSTHNAPLNQDCDPVLDNSNSEYKQEGTDEKIGFDSFGFLIEIINHQIRLGAKPRYDVLACAMITWSMVHGIASLAIKGRLAMVPKEQQQHIFDSIVHAVDYAIFEKLPPSS